MLNVQQAADVVKLNRDGGITCRADRTKARRMSPVQAEAIMPSVKRALYATPALPYVVRA